MFKPEDLQFPPDFFDPPSPRPDVWPDNLILRRAVDWFKSFMSPEQWAQRRDKAARRLYLSAMGVAEGTNDGRFFNSKDTFGWYLFLAEALLDHIGNYDYIFGSRVIPVFQAIGRDLDLLLQVAGVEDRVRSMVNDMKGQPNGCLFELLVAASYRRVGADVAFVPERRGIAQTHDMNVVLNGQTWAVECKRMEVGDYGGREREQVAMRWNECSAHLEKLGRNTLCTVSFRVEIANAPEDYLARKVAQWLASGEAKLTWDDAIATGCVSELDLKPLQEVLKTDMVLASSNRILQLLTGRYVRNANYRTALRTIPAYNPRYVESCDLAVILHWESLSETAIDRKARDIFPTMARANEQLPDGQPGIVHIGFEAVEGDRVERLRHEKILAAARSFDPRSKQLEYVYCHYFVPESPPDECWAFDETTQWVAVRKTRPRPLESTFLVLPESASNRSGPHWQL